MVTAVDAFMRDVQPFLVADALGDFSRDRHDQALEWTAQRCGTVSTAAEVLERIRQGVPDGQTCSVGYGTWDGSESAADLMERVDAALYAAKRAGRDRIQLSPPPDRPSS